jgi:ribose transport system permease protein
MNGMRKSMRFRESGIVLVLALQVLVLWAVAPRVNGESTFMNRENLMQVARAFSFIGTAAVGATIVIVAGGIDLSVGSVLGLTDVVAALCLAGGWGIAPAVALGMIAALACGLASGILVAFAALPPFIATLGMLSIGRGAAYFLTGGRVISGFPESFTRFGQGFLAGVVPYPVVVMLLACVAGAALMKLTSYGRAVHALGGSEEAVKLSGISVPKLKLSVYVLAGAFAGLAGLMYVSRFGYGSSTAGYGYELQVISAVVIGGTSLSGGDGSVLGSVLGAAVMGLLANGLTLLSVPEEYNQLVVGGVIILAVLVDSYRRRREAAR